MHRGTPGEMWRRGECQIQEQFGRILHVHAQLSCRQPCVRVLPRRFCDEGA